MRASYTVERRAGNRHDRARIAIWSRAMKLKPDALRALLLHVEAHATRVHSELEDIDLSGHGAEEVAYHVVIAAEAGLIVATIDQIPDAEDEAVTHVAYSVHRMTYAGHEFLDAVREERHWRAIKAAATAAGAVSVRALSRVAESYIMEIARTIRFGG